MTLLTTAASPLSAVAPPRRLLTLPGWQNSGPGHWQSLWEPLLGATRVEQADWFWPRRGDWMARLDEILLDDEESGVPTVLIAHSLGCHLVAAWAAHSAHSARVAGALLVAPPDLGRPDLPPQLRPWAAPASRAPRLLPFASTVVFSSDDSYCEPHQAMALADRWGARSVPAGAHGHLNADSGLGDWPEGRALLRNLVDLAPTPLAGCPAQTAPPTQ